MTLDKVAICDMLCSIGLAKGCRTDSVHGTEIADEMAEITQPNPAGNRTNTFLCCA